MLFVVVYVKTFLVDNWQLAVDNRALGFTLLRSKNLNNFEPVITDFLLGFDRFFQWGKMYFIIHDSYHHIKFTFEQTFYCRISHPAGDNPVETAWRSTPLDMPENTNTGVNIRQPLLYYFRHFFGTSIIVTFSNHHQVHQFFSFFFFLQRTNQFFNICFSFRDQNIFSTRCNSAVQRDITGIAAHHFNNKKTIMRIRRIPDFVNRFNSRIHGRIKPNGKISSGHILIDGTRNSDTGNFEFGTEFMGTPERTVPSDDDESVNPQFFQIRISPGPSFIFEKFFTTGSFQYGPSSLYNICHTAGVKRDNVIFNNTAITPHNSKHFQSIVNSSADNGPNGGIHTR